jgi:hypothetical protein
MSHRKARRMRIVPLAVVALTTIAVTVVPAVLSPTATAATASLCNSQTAAVDGGSYVVQNNEWNSGASECITADGNPDFTVANSAISNATNGAATRLLSPTPATRPHRRHRGQCSRPRVRDWHGNHPQAVGLVT